MDKFYFLDSLHSRMYSVYNNVGIYTFPRYGNPIDYLRLVVNGFIITINSEKHDKILVWYNKCSKRDLVLPSKQETLYGFDVDKIIKIVALNINTYHRIFCG